MGQVPAFSSFLVVGNGRLARHLRRYFELEALPYYLWSRKSDENLAELAARSSHVLLAISDTSLESFIDENPALKEKTLVHFSGSLTLKNAFGAHPLMTFAADTDYGLETYRKIPFIVEKDRASFETLLPGLRNPSFAIDGAKKGLYHALCTIAGNFTVMLWEKAFVDFESKFTLPKSVLLPYLHQVCENLASAPSGKSVLTGALVRDDRVTIDRHLAELNNDPYRDVYMAFAQAYRLSQSLSNSQSNIGDAK
jgi:hypothetical protein